MSQSWRPATPEHFARLLLPARVQDHLTGYRYEVVARDEKLWQVETHSSDAGHRAARSAAYVVGSGHHALALVANTSGFLTELPAGWFGKSGWRMNPGYERKNHRFGRPITAGCVACHATSAAQEVPAANRFLGVASGIDCRRCHGHPEAHLAYWHSPTADEPPPEARLVHPGHLPPELANDVCLQCHLQGDVSVPLGRASPLDFHPGRRLLDARHDFLIAGQPETLGIASHGARMLHSRCYTASDGKLTCMHCHDPHRPASDFSPAYYDAKCQTCHQPQACSRVTTADEQPFAGGCVHCHMPQRPTREGLHLVFTDHAIRRQPAAVAGGDPVLPPNTRIELVSAWPGARPDAAALGAAYVLLHETMGPQLPALERGRELLGRALAAEPRDLGTRYWLGSALLALARPDEARDEFECVLHEQPAHHEARYRLALAEEAAGNPLAAIRQYERLLADAPHWPEPLVRLTQLCLAQRQPEAAVQAAQRLVSLEPSAAAYAWLALAERLSGASHDRALDTVHTAIELDSREPAAYVTRGTLRLLAGQADLARADFQRAFELDPANSAARQALDTLSGRAPTRP
jgi:Tfp pilus assembly protein PilF